ncbi:MAG: hypothetical protein JRF17_07455 [Deltaproteobacteria bacterium]|jgi:uncharacterized membrane protein|nr:hypothetical protein [Deltaproteobacteria bacterium]
MKQLLEFLKPTAMGGLFVLLPVLLLYLLLAEALGLIVALATPIADLFPKGTFDEIEHPVAMGLILIIGLSFLIELALRSEKGRRLGRCIERSVLNRLPVYNAREIAYNPNTVIHGSSSRSYFHLYFTISCVIFTP